MGNMTEKWDCSYCGKKNVTVRYSTITSGSGSTFVNFSPQCCSDTRKSQTQIEWQGGKPKYLKLYVGTKNKRITL